MAIYTQKDYQSAARVNILEYLQANGYELKKEDARNYSLAIHNSLKIKTDGSWIWYSQDQKGKSPINLLHLLENISKPEAIRKLADYAEGMPSQARAEITRDDFEKEIPRKAFSLPEANGNNNRAIAYLERRGIDRELINRCIQSGLIFESKSYHNVVFVGQKDEAGNIRYANLRGTYSQPFKGDVTGSDKAYSFVLPGKGDHLVVCEAAIEALSHATFAKLRGEDYLNDHRISAGGMSDKAIDRYLKLNPQIRKITLALNNDKDAKENRGQIRAKQLFEKYQKQGYEVNNEIPTLNDINEDLQAYRKTGEDVSFSKESLPKEETLPEKNEDRKEEKKDSGESRTEEALEQINQGIEQAYDSKQYKDTLRFFSKFHKYSLNNCILIRRQKPDATLAAGLKSWEKNDRYVKDGEQGIQILAPIMKNRDWRETKVDPVTGEKKTVKKEQQYLDGYQVVSVFDISQTIGKEIPSSIKPLEGHPEEAKNLLLATIRSSQHRNIPVVFDTIPGNVNGYWQQTSNKIVVKNNLSDLQKIKTMIYELAYAELNNGKKKGEFTKSEKEVQAESIAFIVSDYFGIDTSDYSFPDLVSWSIEKDQAQLRKNMELIKKESGRMIDELEKEYEKIKECEQSIDVTEIKNKAELETAISRGIDVYYQKDGIYEKAVQKIDFFNRPLYIKDTDLQENKKDLPETFDQRLAEIFREGFNRNQLETLHALIQDLDSLDQVLICNDPIILKQIQNADSMKKTMDTIKEQRSVFKEKNEDALVQVVYSDDPRMQVGTFLTTRETDQILKNMDSKMDEKIDSSIRQKCAVGFALYLKMEDGSWKIGKARWNLAEEKGKSLSEFVANKFPDQVTKKIEKELSEEKEPSKKSRKSLSEFVANKFSDQVTKKFKKQLPGEKQSNKKNREERI